jgi:2'-5' RNA ligase
VLRLFFALLPEPAQSAGLVERIAPLVAELGAQAVPATNVHATLCFIGAVPPERLEALRTGAARVRNERVLLSFDCLEHWKKPGILCATSRDASAPTAAHALAAQLCQASAAAGLAPDIKPFRAHLTLARKVNAQQAATCEFPRDLSPPVVLRADGFALMQSQRCESGSIYSVVAEWPLDK